MVDPDKGKVIRKALDIQEQAGRMPVYVHTRDGRVDFKLLASENFS